MISPTALIRKVQNSEPLTEKEIHSLIQSYKEGEVPDYQMSAFLMAVYFKGLSLEEKETLTQAYMNSGQRLEWDEPQRMVDKHSTGGTGDKTSIILAPLLACMGYKVPMMAGRGLGHTGGTLDKLESLEEVSVDLSLEDFKKNVDQQGFAFIGQTEELCPADKKIYALRDVTCTVSSLPLITASIVSKKVAEGVKSLVFDVKTGSGAFIKKLEDSEELAQSLVDTAEKLGVKTVALISDMSQPLGRYVGNELEMLECFEILEFSKEAQEKYRDCIELTLHLCASLIELKEPSSYEQIYQRAKLELASGRPFEKLKSVLKLQGWKGREPAVHELYEDYLVEQEGFVASFNNETIGWASVELGGGRKSLEDQIDPKVGFYFFKKVGDAIGKGEALLRIYYNSKEKLARAKELLNSAYEISPEPVSPPELVYKRVYKSN